MRVGRHGYEEIQLDMDQAFGLSSGQKKGLVVHRTHRKAKTMSPARGAERVGDQMHTSISLRTCI